MLESRREGEYQPSGVCDLVLASAFEQKCHPGHLVAERIGETESRADAAGQERSLPLKFLNLTFDLELRKRMLLP